MVPPYVIPSQVWLMPCTVMVMVMVMAVSGSPAVAILTFAYPPPPPQCTPHDVGLGDRMLYVVPQPPPLGGREGEQQHKPDFYWLVLWCEEARPYLPVRPTPAHQTLLSTLHLLWKPLSSLRLPLFPRNPLNHRRLPLEPPRKFRPPRVFGLARLEL